MVGQRLYFTNCSYRVLTTIDDGVYCGEGEEVVAMKLKLYWSTKHELADVPSNKQFYEVMNLLKQLQKKGITSNIIDTASLPDSEIHRVYQDAVVPSVHQKFGIRRVFGSRRRSGCFFGKEIPAILAYEEGEQYPHHVYPHEEGQGQVRTIYEYLQDVMTGLLTRSSLKSYQSKSG